jgi:hypothetical protein
MQNFHLVQFLAEAFSVPCAPFSMLCGSGGTGRDGVSFPVHGGWDSREVSVVGLWDCVKEFMSFVM